GEDWIALGAGLVDLAAGFFQNVYTVDAEGTQLVSFHTPFIGDWHGTMSASDSSFQDTTAGSQQGDEYNYSRRITIGGFTDTEYVESSERNITSTESWWHLKLATNPSGTYTSDYEAHSRYPHYPSTEPPVCPLETRDYTSQEEGGGTGDGNGFADVYIRIDDTGHWTAAVSPSSVAFTTSGTIV